MKAEILVVGICASGKSTVVQALRKRGYEAATCSQEHTFNRFLWQRKRPTFLVVLDCRRETIKVRRGRDMPLKRYHEQKEKMVEARHLCHLYLKTDELSADETVNTIINAYLKSIEGDHDEEHNSKRS